MMKLVLVVLFISCIHCDDDLTAKLAKFIHESRVFPSIKNDTSAKVLAALLQKEFPNYLLSQRNSKPEPKLADFPCPLTGRSSPRPTNASHLLPGDIDFIGAVGDSLVAAMGALSSSIFTIFTEYRGYSYITGGETDFDDMVTVGNIIKLYNPNVKGYSVGNGGADTTNAGLNVAVSGARSYELSTQIDQLKTKMEDMKVADDDWKLITIFVGGNDLCDYCTDTAKHSPKVFQKNIEAALDSIKAIPHVFVNLITPPDVTLLGTVSSGFCSILHSFECSCASDASTTAAHREYTNALFELAALPKYKDKADFHVSLQPFFSELVMPMKDGQPDRSYFAPDCFHFARKSHAAAGVALWNNMCEDKTKLTTWVPGEPLECPDVYLA